MTGLAAFFVIAIASVAIFVWRDSKHWGEVSPVALLLFFISVVSLPLAVVFVFDPETPVRSVWWVVAGLSFGAALVGLLGRGLWALLVASSFAVCFMCVAVLVAA